MSYLHPSVTELLARLRVRIRAHLVIETVMLVTLLVVVVFWLGLAGDWFFEAARTVRVAGWVLLGVAALAIVAWWGLRRLAVPLADERLAQLLENHFPELGDQLSTAIDLGEETRGMNEELIAVSHREAADAAEYFPERQVLNLAHLSRIGLAAVAGVASIIALAIFAPQVWSVYTQRLALAEIAWPRSVELTIEGFTRNDEGVWVRKVARNDDVSLRVAARLSDGLRDPRRVQIRYRWEGGGRGRDEFTRIGNAEASGSMAQDYTYTFERIADSVDFELRGGDGRLHPLRLEVVDRPKVVRLDMQVSFPEYLDRGNRTLEDVGPRLELPEGASGVIVGETNKPLEQVTVSSPDNNAIAADVSGNSFRIVMPPMDEDASLKIELVDSDGIGSREPFGVAITSRRDELPQVSAIRDGIGTAATVIAQLPIVVEISDDNRLKQAWILLAYGEDKSIRIPIADQSTLGTRHTSRQVIDLRALRSADSPSPIDLAVGDMLSLEVAASDDYDLEQTGHVGTARRIQIEIVSDEELLARLARSELNLRQTFEAIADKLIVLYDDIEKLEPAADSDNGLGASAETDALQVADTDGTEAEAADPMGLALRVARLEENAEQLSTETLGVAQGFREVSSQLENNRIDNEELRDRIGNRIAQPLVTLGEVQLVEVATRIAAITDESSTRSAARQATQKAVRDAETILREMQGLENYNEVIALLRDLIDQQEQLSEKTKTEQKSQLRDLLLE